MLVPALVGSTFDVQVDPTGPGVAVAGPEGLDRGSRRAFPLPAGLFNGDIVQPRPAADAPARPDHKRDPVFRARSHTAQAEASPIARSAQCFGVVVEWQRGHGERRAGRDRASVKVPNLEL